MKSNDQRLREIVEKLRVHRQRVTERGKTDRDDREERKLLRTYRKLVESAG